jgi:hypothetical protein
MCGEFGPDRMRGQPICTMREHLVIRRPEFVAGSRDRPEVGVFTQTHSTRHPVPWDKIALGETVWMKWTAGPVVAKARVSGIRQLESVDSAMLRVTTEGFALNPLESYWASLPPLFSAVTVYLSGEEWLDAPVTVAGRSRGESWIVFADGAMRETWFITPMSSDVTTARRPRPTRTLSASLRFQVFRRDSFTCQYCGRKAPLVALHVDHIRPWSRGGSNDIANLRTSCETCNIGKGATSA